MAERGVQGEKGEVHRQHSYSYTYTHTHRHTHIDTVGHRLPPSERCYTEINVTLLCCLCLLACPACASPSPSTFSISTSSGCCCSYVLVRYLRWQRALPSTAHKSCAINRTLDVLSDPAEAAAAAATASRSHSLSFFPALSHCLSLSLVLTPFSPSPSIYISIYFCRRCFSFALPHFSCSFSSLFSLVKISIKYLNAIAFC